MIKKLFFSALLLFVIFQNVYSQKISNVDFDDIKAKTTDSTSDFYYPKLLSKFFKNAKEMNIEELKMFYYGYVFTEDYNPFGPDRNEDTKMGEFFKVKDFENAALIGKSILEKDPTNLKYNYRMLTCYIKLNDSIKWKEYGYKFVLLAEPVYRSGDGLSINSALVVTRISDEYQILEDMKLSPVSQSLIGECDFLKVKQPNKLNIEGLYFNTKFSRDYLRNMIKEYNK